PRAARTAAPPANGAIASSTRLTAAVSAAPLVPPVARLPAPKISSGTASGITSRPDSAAPPRRPAVTAATVTPSAASPGVPAASAGEEFWIRPDREGKQHGDREEEQQRQHRTAACAAQQQLGEIAFEQREKDAGHGANSASAICRMAGSAND